MKNLLLLTLLIPCIAFSQSSADQDGSCSVDVRDFNAWNENAFTVLNPGDHPIKNGDYNLDGFIDGSDFNIWNANKFENITTNKIQIDIIGTNIETDIPVRIMSKLNGTTPVEFPFANTLHLTSSPSSDITAEVTTGNSYFTCLDGQNGSLILKAQASDDFDNPTVMYEAMSDSASSAMVLTNGMRIDEVNHLFGVTSDTAPQQRLIDVVSPYLNGDGEVSIPNNQVIVAFELNDDPKDYNDLVVMVTLGEGMSFDYEELGFHVGDPIGLDNTLVEGAGAVSSHENLAKPGFSYVSDGSNTLQEIRAMIGHEEEGFSNGIDWTSWNFNLLIYTESDYWANLPHFNSINIGQPFNIMSYIPNMSGFIIPDSPIFANSGMSSNKDLYDSRFDLSLTSLGSIPLTSNNYIIELVTNHVAAFVGGSIQGASDSSAGTGPVAYLQGTGIPRRLLDQSGNDAFRWAISLIVNAKKTFNVPTTALNKTNKKNQKIRIKKIDKHRR